MSERSKFSAMPGNTPEEKLVLNSVRDGSCLRWTGAHTPKGYGQIRVGGTARPVHVLAHELWVGPVEQGLEVDHVLERGCVNRDCIERTHLEAITHAENIRRRAYGKIHCANGHEYTDENTKTKNRNGETYRVCKICYNASRRRSYARRVAK